MRLELRPFVLRLRAPLRTARGEIRERHGLRVVLRADGLAGRGEAAPWSALGTEGDELCRRALEGFVGAAPPGSLDDVEVALAAHPALARAPAARSALEAALLELLALRRGLSVAALLAPSPRAWLDANALVEGGDAAGLARAGEAAVARGFETLKVKLAARSFAADAERLAALRKAVGGGVRIRADANGGWTEGEARVALRSLEGLALELCEQPVAGADVEGLRRLASELDCPLAADEALADEDTREQVLAEGLRPAADALVLKPLVLGGLLPALRLAIRARERGVAAYVTTSLDGPLARAAAAHLAAALPEPLARRGDADHLERRALGAPLAHGLATVEDFEGFEGDDAYAPRGGRVVMPGGGGFGPCAEAP